MTSLNKADPHEIGAATALLGFSTASGLYRGPSVQTFRKWFRRAKSGEQRYQRWFDVYVMAFNAERAMLEAVREQRPFTHMPPCNMCPHFAGGSLG